MKFVTNPASLRGAASLLVIVFVLATAGSAHAALFGPGDAELTGSETGQAAININSSLLAYINALCQPDSPYTSIDQIELYKDGDGPFADSYETAYTAENGAGDDITTATITFNVGEDFISTHHKFALVKDGNASPAWYFIDISTWNGTDVLKFDQFWEGPPGDEARGAISHVALYGCEGEDIEEGPLVPEPASLAIWAMGLGIAGIMGRRRLRR